MRVPSILPTANAVTAAWGNAPDVEARSLWGITFATNPSVPEGVLCIVPSGADLTDRRVLVRANSPASRQAAKRFAFLLAALRDGRSDFIFPIPNEETL